MIHFEFTLLGADDAPNQIFLYVTFQPVPFGDHVEL